MLLLTWGCRRVDEDEGRPAPVATPAPVVPDEVAPPAAAPVTTQTFVVPDFARVADDLAPSVVSVVATVPRASGPNKVVRGLGSGVVVSTRGQILTNEHVVAAATRVDVELSTRERIPAKVVFAEPLLDLALLELNGDVRDLVPVTISTRPSRRGEWVMAMGQPFGLGHTVTVGVISGLDRDYADLGKPSGLKAEGMWKFIQTDASINGGNSGGPLVDSEGRIVGVTTAVRNDAQGLAFAIPSAMVQHFLDEVRTHGRVRKTRLGIKAEDVIESPVVRITQVDEGGPAAKAGLRIGDLILRVDDVDVNRVSDVAYETQLRGVGARITLTVVRAEGGTEELLVIPAEGR